MRDNNREMRVLKNGVNPGERIGMRKINLFKKNDDKILTFNR